MKLMLKYCKPYRKQIIALALLCAISATCGIFLPYVMSNIVEIGIRQGNLRYVLTQGGLMLILAVVAMLSTVANNRISSYMLPRVTSDIRQAMFEKVNSLSVEQFQQIGASSLITRTTDDVDFAEQILGQVPYVLVSAPIMFVGGVVLSFNGDWVLPLILLGVSAVVLVITLVMTRSLEGLWARADKLTDKQNQMVRERLSGVRVIRTFDKSAYEHERTADATSRMCNSFVKANVIGGLVNPIASLLLNVASAAILYVGAERLTGEQTLLAGDVLATVQYVALIINAIVTMSWTIAFLPHVKVSFDRIGEVLQMPSELPQQGGSARKVGGEISFCDVDFSYHDGAEALSKVNFHASEGEIVGVIGGTGSGKTTLVKLIADFYSSSGGVRLLDGNDYNELGSFAVRDNVSVALQNAMIFNATIADNVRAGNEKATDEEIEEALRVAQMEDFIRSVEGGINYELTQYGTNVSGGQKQRINIARTILKDASVYVFDDSFSALDYKTEADLRVALNKRLQSKTQIIVTQRAATAMRCDKVYCLDEGKVVGVGTHEQLLNTCSKYRQIVASQLGGGVSYE